MLKHILLVLLLLCSTSHAKPLSEKCESLIGNMLNDSFWKSDKQRNERIQICVKIIESSVSSNIDFKLSLAIAWHESRFTYADNGYCLGPLQIKTKYWCENKNGEWSEHKADGYEPTCDLIHRGVFAIKYWSDKRGEGSKRMLCAYAGSPDCISGQAKEFAYSVPKIKLRISKIWNAIE
jgi:hypothetical protein